MSVSRSRDAASRDPGLQDAHGILQSLRSGVLSVSPDGMVLFVNSAFERLFGVRGTDIRDRSLWQAVPALANAAEAALVRATLEDGRPREWRAELRDERRSGTYDIRVTRDRAGALLLEVSDAAAAARTEQHHDRMLESIGEAVAVVGPDWRVTLWNAAAERMTGVPRETVVGQRLWERFPGIVRAPLYRMLRDAVARGGTAEVRNWHYRGDTNGGGRGCYDVRAHPLDGGGLLVLFVEVTAQMRRDRELLERTGENDWLRDLLRAMAGVAESAELLALLCASAREHCGARGAVVGRMRDQECQVVTSTGETDIVAGMRIPIAGPAGGAPIAVRGQRPTAAEQYDHVRSRMASLLPGEGRSLTAPLIAHEEMLGIVAVTRAADAAPFTPDDERRLSVIADHAALVVRKAGLLEEAQQANAAKAAFLSTMSHELRTPLTALTGYEELLVDEIFGPLAPPQQEIVERMRSVTHHLSSMIEDMLAYASLEAGREQIRTRHVSVNEVAEAAVAVVAPQAAEKGLSVDVELPDAPVHIHTDPDKLRQILLNLLGNAIKFTDRGQISLRMRAEPDQVELVVRDTGIGIAECELPRLFQPFGQLDAGLTRRHGGTGLGLYISSRLAALLGGDVQAASEAGAGSTFTVRMPRG